MIASEGDCLDTLGIVEGTDKSSLFNDYLRHYELRFRALRDAPINLIEIGVAGGSSLRMWSEYFPNATIIGVDIVEEARQFEGGRVKIEIGSQDDPTFLSDLCARFPPTIFIDDGSHFARHMLFTLKHVFPLVLPGGWYVIEDLWIAMEMEKIAVTPHQYLADIASSNISLRRYDIESDSLRSAVESIEFVPGAAFLRRQDRNAALQRLLAVVPSVERSVQPNNWHWLSQSIVRLGGPLDLAEMAARRAIVLHAEYPLYRIALGDVLERQGRNDEALECAKAGVALDPTVPLWHLRYGEILAKLGRREQARSEINEAMQLAEPEQVGFFAGELRRLCGDDILG